MPLGKQQSKFRATSIQIWPQTSWPTWYYIKACTLVWSRITHKYDIWYFHLILKFDIWNKEFDNKHVIDVIWHLKFNIWHWTSHCLLMLSELWHFPLKPYTGQQASDAWHLKYDIWHQTSDIWHLQFDIWQLASFIWHLISDIWHLTFGHQTSIFDICHLITVFKDIHSWAK